MYEIFIPATGMAPDDVTLEVWLKQPGDHVDPGDVVAVVETSKATLDVQSDVAGVLGEHLVRVEEAVAPGTTIVRVSEAGDAPVASPPQQSEERRDTGKLTEMDPEPGVQVVDGAVGPGVPDYGLVANVGEVQAVERSETAGLPETGERQPHRTSPRARRLAAEATVTPPTEIVTDRMAASTAHSARPESPSAPPPPPRRATTPDAAKQVPTPGTVKGSVDPAERYRAAVAASVSRSWQEIPHFTVTRELRMDRFDKALRRVRVVLPQVNATDLLLRALALAFLHQADSTELDIGLAVATDRGVSIPVVTGVPRLDLIELAASRLAAVERARAGRAHSDDGRLPACTLSNLGALRIDQFTGIVPLGQTSLLTVGRIASRPVVRNDRVRPALTMFATLNVDHRAWDGQHAAALLDRLAAITANPELLIGFGRPAHTRQDLP